MLIETEETKTKTLGACFFVSSLVVECPCWSPMAEQGRSVPSPQHPVPAPSAVKVWGEVGGPSSLSVVSKESLSRHEPVLRECPTCVEGSDSNTNLL